MVSVLLSAHVERVFVSRMQDFFVFFPSAVRSPKEFKIPCSRNIGEHNMMQSVIFLVKGLIHSNCTFVWFLVKAIHGEVWPGNSMNYLHICIVLLWLYISKNPIGMTFESYIIFQFLTCVGDLSMTFFLLWYDRFEQ